jgi:hypothetical protein
MKNRVIKLMIVCALCIGLVYTIVWMIETFKN